MEVLRPHPLPPVTNSLRQATRGICYAFDDLWRQGRGKAGRYAQRLLNTLTWLTFREKIHTLTTEKVLVCLNLNVSRKRV